MVVLPVGDRRDSVATMKRPVEAAREDLERGEAQRAISADGERGCPHSPAPLSIAPRQGLRTRLSGSSAGFSSGYGSEECGAEACDGLPWPSRQRPGGPQLLDLQGRRITSAFATPARRQHRADLMSGTHHVRTQGLLARPRRHPVGQRGHGIGVGGIARGEPLYFAHALELAGAEGIETHEIARPLCARLCDQPQHGTVATRAQIKDRL